MKKLFTIDDFMVAFISALGYGLGAEIPMLLGWPGWMSTLISMAAGMALEALISKIAFFSSFSSPGGRRSPFSSM